jgi:hypothetical protein
MATCHSENPASTPTPMVAWPFAPQWLALGETAALLGLDIAREGYSVRNTGMKAHEAGKHFLLTLHKEACGIYRNRV